MYRVIIRHDGVTDGILETDKMSSRDVYKYALGDIKWKSRTEKSSCYNSYDAYVYKDGKFLYLLGLSDFRYLSKKFIGLTRASDLKTCVIRSII